MKKTLPQFWSFNRLQDASLMKTEDIIWQGPFSWIEKRRVIVSFKVSQSRSNTMFTNHNKENEIADKNKIPVWEIAINEDNTKIAIDKDFIFTATLKKNGKEVQDALFVWESSDEAIGTVNNGIVDGHSVGNVTIYVYVQDKPDIKISIELEVVESLPDIITYKMWCSYPDGRDKSYTDFSILYGDKKLYGVEKYVNGSMAITNDTYTFSLDANGTPSTKYNYTVLDNVKVEIEAKGNPYKLILTATSNEIGESITQIVQLKYLW